MPSSSCSSVAIRLNFIYTVLICSQHPKSRYIHEHIDLCDIRLTWIPVAALLCANGRSSTDSQLATQSNASLSRRVVVQRVATVVACVGVVAASVFIRHLVNFHFLPDNRSGVLFTNITAADWRNETTWQDVTMFLWKVM